MTVDILDILDILQLEKDFKRGSGKAIFESESSTLRLIKVCDQLAYERFNAKNSKDYGELFVNVPNKNIANASIGAGLSGEFFCNVRFGSHLIMGNDVNLMAHGPITIGDDVFIGNEVQLITIFESSNLR